MWKDFDTADLLTGSILRPPRPPVVGVKEVEKPA